MSETWTHWESQIPRLTNQKEQYTAILVQTLRRLVLAPFEWTLTGGTALQSYLPLGLRRYSTDIEVMTQATGKQVSAWLTTLNIDHKAAGKNVILAQLTPHGTLFVFHDYPPVDYALAKTVKRPFEHFPIHELAPPAHSDVPMASMDFLLATKLFFLQKDDRGGERAKDVSDLVKALPLGTTEGIRTALTGFLKHYGSPLTTDELIRGAGVRIRLVAGPGHAEFVKWHGKMVPKPSTAPKPAQLLRLVQDLEAIIGQPIQETPLETVRALLQQMSLKKVAQIATRHAYTGKTNMEAEKMIDFVAMNCLPQLTQPLPNTADELYKRLAP